MHGDASDLSRLREEHDRVRAILSAVAAGYLVSKDRVILEVNDTLCEMLGFSREELLGSTMPWPFMPPEGIEVALALTDKLVNEALHPQAGSVQSLEVPMMRKDGSRFICDVALRLARNPDGSTLGWVSTIRDVSRRHDYEAELERLATHDPLTGLANRRLFEQRLEQELADAIRHERSLAVAILDLDRFKDVNDQHGHPVGDRALRETATRLESVQRKGELFARVGGEEFAWILPEVDSHGAWAAVERARHAISDVPFEGIGHLTISIGVGLRSELEESAALYERADQSLYRAKRDGRNRSIMWRPI
jgi:diguanylate cyclase (GGDEF)-like protein/PAS domain S-box-containing protein